MRNLFANKKGQGVLFLAYSIVNHDGVYYFIHPPRAIYIITRYVSKMLSTGHQVGTLPYLHQALDEQIMILNDLYLESLSPLRTAVAPRCLD